MQKNKDISHDNTKNLIYHYDKLIEEDNDPVHDPKSLKEYMKKWDGEGFIEALLLKLNKSVLEIGVGTGRLALDICSKSGSFTGIDISPKTIERAKKNLQAFSNANLICGDFLTYEFGMCFDIIYSSLTFMHIKEKSAAIQKAADLLDLGGRFVLSIDKNQRTAIDYGSRVLEVFPDNPEQTLYFLNKAGLCVKKHFETDFAVIFVADKIK